jgi:hypothetical protein
LGVAEKIGSRRGALVLALVSPVFHLIVPNIAHFPQKSMCYGDATPSKLAVFGTSSAKG